MVDLSPGSNFLKRLNLESTGDYSAIGPDVACVEIVNDLGDQSKSFSFKQARAICETTSLLGHWWAGDPTDDYSPDRVTHPLYFQMNALLGFAVDNGDPHYLNDFPFASIPGSPPTPRADNDPDGIFDGGDGVVATSSQSFPAGTTQAAVTTIRGPGLDHINAKAHMPNLIEAITGVGSSVPHAHLVFARATATEVNIGDPFELIVDALNLGATADVGDIDVSVPSVTSAVASATDPLIEPILADSSHLSPSEYRAGSTIFNASTAMTAQYLLLSGSTGPWQASQRRTMRLRVTPRRAGDLVIYARTALGMQNFSRDVSHAPGAANLSDQQGFPVTGVVVKVNDNIVVENQGAARLLRNQGTGAYFIASSSSTVPLTMGGKAIGASTYPGFEAIAAEPDGAGFGVILAKSDKTSYTVWKTDAQGAYQSSVWLDGKAIALYESQFQQDLNGLNGVQSMTVKDQGPARLVRDESDGVLYIKSPSGVVTLNVDGAPVKDSQYASQGYSILAAEQKGTGYVVALKHTSGGYMIWTTDQKGMHIAHVTVDAQRIGAYEIDFQEDFDGNGTIGPTLVVKEQTGSASLLVDPASPVGAYFLRSAAGTIPLTLSGVAIGDGTWVDYKAIAVEPCDGGFLVAFKPTTSGKLFTIWRTDTLGRWTSNVWIDEKQVGAYEADLKQDLNEVLGLQAFNAVESNGVCSLLSDPADNGVLYLRTGQGVATLNTGGTPVWATKYLSGSMGWSILAAEPILGGFRVALRHSDGDYLIWSTDGKGTWLGSISVPAAQIGPHETQFQQDLNGTGGVGN